jgi:RNA polymerase sigma-70 factor, ECF subfamily
MPSRRSIYNAKNVAGLRNRPEIEKFFPVIDPSPCRDRIPTVMFEQANLETSSHELEYAPFEALQPVRTSKRVGRLILKMTHDELIEAIAESQDKMAFRQLFEHFAPRLKSYLLRLGADPATAEDVAQEAMVMVWRKAASFDRRQAGASTWIFTIARNKRIDRLRRERRPELDPEDPGLVPAAEPAPDRSLQDTQARQHIASAMRALPDEQAELVRRAFFDDESHSRIAEESGLPLGTVKSRIRLALTRLRHEMKEFE